MSAGEVDVDGLADHRGDEVVPGSRITGSGIGARERLTRANRVDRALVQWGGAGAIHDDLQALRAQLVDRGIDRRWAGRGRVGGRGQSEGCRGERAGSEGSDE